MNAEKVCQFIPKTFYFKTTIKLFSILSFVLCFFKKSNLDYCRSYSACRENEKCQDQLLDCKLGRGKVLSEKEQLKLGAKRKKSESAVRKCDMEYYAAAIKSERSR